MAGLFWEHQLANLESTQLGKNLAHLLKTYKDRKGSVSEVLDDSGVVKHFEIVQLWSIWQSATIMLRKDTLHYLSLPNARFLLCRYGMVYNQPRLPSPIRGVKIVQDPSDLHLGWSAVPFATTTDGSIW